MSHENSLGSAGCVAGERARGRARWIRFANGTREGEKMRSEGAGGQPDGCSSAAEISPNGFFSAAERAVNL